MRILRIAMILTIGLGVLGIDVGESVRTGAISDGSAHAKRHHKRRHHRHHKRARRHRRAPATEM